MPANAMIASLYEPKFQEFFRPMYPNLLTLLEEFQTEASGSRGYSDLVSKMPVLTFIEVKVNSGVLSPLQRMFLTLAKKNGFNTMVARVNVQLETSRIIMKQFQERNGQL